MTTTDRALAAARLLKTTEPERLGRSFDNCFEAGDGGEVKAQVMGLALHDIELVAAMYAHNLAPWVDAAFRGAGQPVPTKADAYRDLFRHTPGPWSSALDEAPYFDRYLLANSGVHFGHFQGWAADGITTPEEDAANARLIAAAPDLLDALRECVTAFDRLTASAGAGVWMDESQTFRVGDWLNGNGNNGAIRRARAAIEAAGR